MMISDTYPTVVVDLQDSQTLTGAKIELTWLSRLIVHLYSVDLVHQWIDSDNVTHAKIFG